MIKIVEEGKSFILRDGTYSIGERSILIHQAQRSDGVVIRSPVYLPLSQINLRRNSIGVSIEIPDWLYKKKYTPSFSPFGG